MSCVAVPHAISRPPCSAITVLIGPGAVQVAVGVLAPNAQRLTVPSVEPVKKHDPSAAHTICVTSAVWLSPVMAIGFSAAISNCSRGSVRSSVGKLFPLLLSPRACLEVWLGQARHVGVAVTVHGNVALAQIAARAAKVG